MARKLLAGTALLLAISFSSLGYAELAGIKKGMVNNLSQMQMLFAYLAAEDLRRAGGPAAALTKAGASNERRNAGKPAEPYYAALRMAGEKMEQALTQKDMAAAVAAYGELAKVCTGCHTALRKK